MAKTSKAPTWADPPLLKTRTCLAQHQTNCPPRPVRLSKLGAIRSQFFQALLPAFPTWRCQVLNLNPGTRLDARSCLIHPSQSCLLGLETALQNLRASLQHLRCHLLPDPFTWRCQWLTLGPPACQADGLPLSSAPGKP